MHNLFYFIQIISFVTVTNIAAEKLVNLKYETVADFETEEKRVFNFSPSSDSGQILSFYNFLLLPLSPPAWLEMVPFCLLFIIIVIVSCVPYIAKHLGRLMIKSKVFLEWVLDGMRIFFQRFARLGSSKDFDR